MHLSTSVFTASLINLMVEGDQCWGSKPLQVGGVQKYGRKSRRELFFDEIGRIVRWSALLVRRV